MSFLPIVDRELRVAARRPRTYWSRLGIAFVAIAVGAVLLGVYSLEPQAQIGKTLFWALTGLSFVYCLFAGRLATADSISEEKREGTLGLLFLTDLKGYDIVFGKVFATSLNSFYGLLAVFPVLALPLLLGGMTNGEFARMVLVLVNTFLLSLAIGICCSALSRDARRAYGGNLLMSLLVLVLVPWLTAFLYARAQATPLMQNPVPEFFLASPIYAAFAAEDTRYGFAAKYFWGSIIVTQVWIWLLLGIACRAVPRTWQDQPSVTRGARFTWRGFWRWLSYGSAAKQKPFRKRLLDVNGFYWLTARSRLKPLHVWLLILGAAAWWVAGWWLTDDQVWFDASIGIALAFILNTAIKLWIAMEAGQQLAEDRRAGSLELILSTQLTIRDILKGQFLALRRQFLGPLLAIIAIEIGFMVMSLRDYYATQTLYLWLAGIFMLLADSVALALTAMATALVAKNQQQMITRTINRILVLPWLAFVVISVLAKLWISLGSNAVEPLPWQFTLGLWFVLGLTADLLFGFRSWRRLGQFRQLAAERFDAPVARTRWRLLPTRGAATASIEVATPEQLVARKTRRRRLAFAAATALALLAVAGGYVYRQLNPKPPGAITLALAPGASLRDLRVFPGDHGFFLVPPDRSLWHWGVDWGRKDVPPGTPRRVDDTHEWREVWSSRSEVYGLRTDGSLWFTPRMGNTASFEFKPLGVDRDWAALFVGHQHSGAIKTDGTLWMWGHNWRQQLGTAAVSRQADPTQVGTNRNWKMIVPLAQGTLGLQTDGSLWFWGQIPFIFNPNVRQGAVFATPTRYSVDTNWTGLAALSAAFARDAGGVWHTLFQDLPHPATPAATNSRPFLRQAQSDRLVFGIAVRPNLTQAVYEVREPGALMLSHWTHPTAATGFAESWLPFDQRTDWLGVWSNGGTMLGLTADGTLWTWGLDLAAAGRVTLSQLKVKLAEMLGRRPPARGMHIDTPPLQVAPRPLIKFVSERPALEAAHP
jgi:ABC-type transport system involved in cytochrome c biogenesis permease component